jgi:hypothetical protein
MARLAPRGAGVIATQDVALDSTRLIASGVERCHATRGAEREYHAERDVR